MMQTSCSRVCGAPITTGVNDALRPVNHLTPSQANTPLSTQSTTRSLFSARPAMLTVPYQMPMHSSLQLIFLICPPTALEEVARHLPRNSPSCIPRQRPYPKVMKNQCLDSQFRPAVEAPSSPMTSTRAGPTSMQTTDCDRFCAHVKCPTDLTVVSIMP